MATALGRPETDEPSPVPREADVSASGPTRRRVPRESDDAEPAAGPSRRDSKLLRARHAVCELKYSMNTNGARIRVVALLAAATLARGALGETGDHVAACYSPSTTVRLSNREHIVLNQNSPNPFAEQTTITYKLPSTVRTAKMLFYDAQGELIRAVDLSSRRRRSDDRLDEIAECAGEGRLFIFADDLRAGLYTYALVVDDRTVGSKQMVKR